MAYNIIGKNFTPPDVRAKITGKAKYAEDFTADGMVYVKMLLSPMPNANVTNIDASEALAMDGVIDILTAEDVPPPPPPRKNPLRLVGLPASKSVKPPALVKPPLCAFPRP